MELIIYLLVKE